MAIRDYLSDKEEELTQQLEELRRKREPLEAELADVRRARAALGPEPPSLLNSVRMSAAPKGNFADWTFKQMAIRALQDHFPSGTTAQKLLEFFETAYGRKIERSSLSPQLSRLAAAGIIQREGSKIWRLAPQRTEDRSFQDEKQL